MSNSNIKDRNFKSNGNFYVSKRKTEMCKYGRNCKKHGCKYAHTQAELIMGRTNYAYYKSKGKSNKISAHRNSSKEKDMFTIKMQYNGNSGTHQATFTLSKKGFYEPKKGKLTAKECKMEEEDFQKMLRYRRRYMDINKEKISKQVCKCGVNCFWYATDPKYCLRIHKKDNESSKKSSKETSKKSSNESDDDKEKLMKMMKELIKENKKLREEIDNGESLGVPSRKNEEELEAKTVLLSGTDTEQSGVDEADDSSKFKDVV